MKPVYFTTFLCIFLLGMIRLEVHAQFTLSSEFRPRFEYRNGYSRLPDSSTQAAIFVSQRTRLTARFLNKNVEYKLTVQEVRVWGDEKTKSKVATLGMYEGWLNWKLHDSLHLKIGRQELVYDNERMFGNNNWTITGQSHDAVVFKARYKGWKADLGAAFNQAKDNVFGTAYSNQDAAIDGNYKSLNFLWIEKSGKEYRFSVFDVVDGYQKLSTANTTYLRNTAGINFYYELKSVSLIARACYQSGKTQNGQGIDAFYLNPEVIFKPDDKFTLNPGAEIISGKDFTSRDDTRYRAFSTLYGTGHKFNGHMDYFTNFPVHTKQAGLVNPYLRMSWKYSENTRIGLDYNYFALENNYVPTAQTGSISKDLGSEIDLNCSINFPGDINLLFGYSIMLASKSMEYIIGGDASRTGQWGFVMLTFKPTLFSQAK